MAIYADRMRDIGPKVAFVAVREGTPVHNADGKRIGVVEEVIADATAAIFKGVVIHTVPLPGRHLVADVEHIGALHERGVVLSVGRDTLRTPARDHRPPAARSSSNDPCRARCAVCGTASAERAEPSDTSAIRQRYADALLSRASTLRHAWGHPGIGCA